MALIFLLAAVLAFSASAHSLFHTPVDYTITAAIDYGTSLSQRVAAAAGVPDQHATTVAAFLGLLAPAILVAGAAALARLGKLVTAVASTGLVLAAIVSFWHVETGQALLLLFLAVVAAAILNIGGTLVVWTVCAAAGMFAGRLVASVVNGELGALASTKAVLADAGMVPASVSPGLYLIMLGAWALVPLLAALAILTGTRPGDDSSD